MALFANPGITKKKKLLTVRNIFASQKAILCEH
jgi:hypothetical protein